MAWKLLGILLLPVWIIISWVIHLRSAEYFGGPRRRPCIALGMYLVLLVGNLLKYLVLRDFSQPSSQSTVMYGIGALADTMGKAGLLGWAVSPGGMIFLYVPLGVLIQRWPRGYMPPIAGEVLPSWTHWSTVVALLIGFLNLATNVLILPVLLFGR